MQPVHICFWLTEILYTFLFDNHEFMWSPDKEKEREGEREIKDDQNLTCSSSLDMC